jgi:hypothetical protein
MESKNGNPGQDWFSRSNAVRYVSAAVVIVCVVFSTLGHGGSCSAAPVACANLPRAAARDFPDRLNAFVQNFCYQKQRWQHDAQVRTSDGVHLFVQVWYSPSLFNWMTIGKRRGPVPDGAILIKEEHLTQTAPLLLWSLMVKDSNLSWDGWYWGILFPSGAQTPLPTPATVLSAPATSAACPEPQAQLTGTGLYCLNCHASAKGNRETTTFASTAYLSSIPGHAGLTSALVNNSVAAGLARASAAKSEELDRGSDFTGRVPAAVFKNVKSLSDVPCMVPQQFDHVVSRSPKQGGPSLFVTADQCSGCHDATGTVSSTDANMIFDPQGPSPANLSAYGEWRYSMMGLAGRDPIFFAQLDTESNLHRHLAGKANGAAFVQDLCLRCHGVMGQRQFHLDRGNAPDVLFTRNQLADPNSKYGALARDGVSCAVCHHISDGPGDNPADPSTFTGLFKLGPATSVYGPYSSDPDPTGAKSGDSVIPRPMQNALGITPKQGTHIQQADLCASCHTISLPVFDSQGRPVIENRAVKHEYEQTTFFEWQNSDFGGISCQQCHMPDSFQGTPLDFKIANIEDSTFPRVPETGPSTRLPDAQLILQDRSPYMRHQLLGINVFALEMFDQFRPDLGLFKTDPNLPSGLAATTLSQHTAVAGAVLQAQSATATVTIQDASIASGVLQADVKVQNLAGHDFPSGVSFRRAFLNFQVLDRSGNVLWASGNTNSAGVIVDNSGNPLTTEFFGPGQQTFQPHFWTDNPITSDKQVQIYEELFTDPQGLLTTSFLSLDNKVKDNRLQPTGRSANGPGAEITKPIGTTADPSYQNGCGCSIVRYEVPVTGSLGNAASVAATLYYQSIPPYYLSQRSEEGNGPDTTRFINFASQLNTSQYPEIANWKLEIATSGPVELK